LKDGKNIIDWARSSPQVPWRVENVTNLKTVGTELGLTFYPEKIFSTLPFTKIGVQYTYLSSNRETGGYQSKYILDYLKHQLLITVFHKLPFSVQQNWILRFEDRENFPSHFIVDTQLTSQIENFNIFIRANNLFNTAYFDIAGIPMPGRWLSAGLEYNY